MKHPTKEQYRRVAGLKLGDHFGSDDYTTDETVRWIADDGKSIGAWVKTWIWVSDDEVNEEKENITA